MIGAVRRLYKTSLFCILSFLAFGSTAAYAIGQCPPVGYSSSCSALITINPNGSLSIENDPGVIPYDGDEDTLIGVVNKSGATVFGISLSGAGIFGFDGDGANNGDYAGPGVSFTIQDSNRGTVNFNNGLDNNQFIWFSLEGAPSAIKLTSRITIDPGHGYNCAMIGQKVGAVGVTNFPPSNPPSGELHEDNLTVAIASQLQQILTNAGYDVTMTKSDVVSCPTLRERGVIANKAHSNIFVSVHINAARTIFGVPYDNGTSVFYNTAKTSSRTLAQQVVNNVSSTIGTNNRGISARDDLVVLQPTVSRMTSVLVETARLSGSDEQFLHAPYAPTVAAYGIKTGVDKFLNQ